MCLDVLHPASAVHWVRATVDSGAEGCDGGQVAARGLQVGLAMLTESLDFDWRVDWQNQIQSESTLYQEWRPLGEEHSCIF